MLDTLKKLARKNALTRLAVAILIAIVLLGLTDFGIFLKLKEPIKLSQIDSYDLDKQYIKTDMYFTIGVYMEQYKDNSDTNAKNTTDYYYYVPVYTDNTLTIFKYFVGIQVPIKENQPFDDALNYFLGYLEDAPDVIHIEGTLEPMKSQEKKFYTDALLNAEFSAEDIETYAMPYRINMNYLGKTPAPITYILSGLSLMALLYGALVMIKFALGTYKSKLSRFYKDNPEATMEAMDYDFKSAITVDNTIWIGRKYTLYYQQQKAHILKNQDLIWAYYHENIKKSRSGSKVTRYIVAYNKDKKCNKIRISSNFAGNKIIDYYAKTQPQIVKGYTKELDSMFHNNHQEFLSLSQSNIEKAGQETATSIEF